MLGLDWSSGMGGLKCVGRADLTLSGSFADMVLSPIASSRQSGTFLFLLTNPGQLQAYADTSLASLMSQKENKISVSPLPYPMVVPTMDPHMTVAMFAALNVNDKTSLALSEVVPPQIFLVVLPIVRLLIYILFLIDSLSCKSSNPTYFLWRKCTMASDRWCSKPP